MYILGGVLCVLGPILRGGGGYVSVLGPILRGGGGVCECTWAYPEGGGGGGYVSVLGPSSQL